MAGTVRLDDPGEQGLDHSLQSVEADVSGSQPEADRPRRRLPLVPAPLVRQRRHRRESVPRDPGGRPGPRRPGSPPDAPAREHRWP